MPRHDADARLGHMLDAAREAAQMAQGKTRAAGRAAVIGNVLQISASWGQALPLTSYQNPSLCGQRTRLEVAREEVLTCPVRADGRD